MPLRYPAEKILVRCPNWVGDAVMATPTLRCLRRNYPHARITLLLRRYVRKVFEHAPWFDDLFELTGAVGTARALRPRRYELAVLLVHSFHSAMVARMIGATRRVGYTRGDQRLLLTDPLPAPRAGLRWALVPKVGLYAGITRYLGCEGWDDMRQQLFYSRPERLTMDGLLRRKGADPARPLVALSPGAGYGTSKRWLPDRFAAVGDGLAERLGASCVAVGSPGEMDVVEEIAGAMRSRLIRFEDGEMDLGLLKPLVAASSLMIATDSGPRHYAVALGVPVVVLMGPTHPRKTESDYRKTRILRHDVACGPCYRRVCPTDHGCMRLITVDEVMEAAAELLSEHGPSAGWAERLSRAPGEAGGLGSGD